MMKIPGLAAFALLVSVASLDAQAPPCKGESALVHVDSISFFLTAPPGWTLDCAAGKNDGPLVVLYRTGESWQSGAAVMYANVLSLDAAGGAAFRARIRAEAAAWTADVPDAQVAEGRSLRTNAGALALTRQFVSRKQGLHEVVAYIPRGRSIPLLVLTARSDLAFNAALPAFEALVRSYAPGPTVKVP